MSAWEAICQHGDSEDMVRAALLDDFDNRWPAVARSIRDQLLEQGMTLDVALDVAEQVRRVFRNEAAAGAPRIVDMMAVSAKPTH